MNDPGWETGLIDSFKMTHFYGVDYGSLNLDLSHVMSWEDIKCQLDMLLEAAFNAEQLEKKNNLPNRNPRNYDAVQLFILRLFELDTEAVVEHGSWCPPLKPWREQYGRPWYAQDSARKFVGSCKDNDEGKKDKNGKGCSDYYGHIDFCKKADIPNVFQSLEMCCACGGGVYEKPTPKLVVKDHACESTLVEYGPVSIEDCALHCIRRYRNQMWYAPNGVDKGQCNCCDDYSPIFVESPNDNVYEISENDFELLDLYLSPDLIQKNKNFLSNILSKIDQINFKDEKEKPSYGNKNCPLIVDILSMANSSPANLRYGYSSSNRAIKAGFDPMGDSKGVITTKENNMLRDYVVTYQAKCYEDNKCYIGSSTGSVVDPDPISSQTAWSNECRATTETCYKP